MNRVIIWGAGSYGKYAMNILENANGYEIVAFCDTNKELIGDTVSGYKVISKDEALQLCKQDNTIILLIGVAREDYKKQITQLLEQEFPASIKIADRKLIVQLELKMYREKMLFQWNVNIEERMHKWLDDIYSEVEFWLDVTFDKSHRWHFSYERAQTVEEFGIPALEKSLTDGSIVMDIGCGVLSPYGKNLSNGKCINLIMVDALACFYNKINQMLIKNNENLRLIDFGIFECMAYFYSKNYADAINIRNAMDHCIDPFRGIIHCLYILKVGSTMLLTHAPTEAINASWNGLHQWNFDMIDNHLVIWDKSNSVDISNKLAPFAEVKVRYEVNESDPEQSVIIAEIVKKKDFTIEQFFALEEDNRVLVILLKELMQKYVQESLKFQEMIQDYSARFLK